MFWKYAANLQENVHAKVWLQLYGNHTSAWVFSGKFATYSQKHLFLTTPLDGCFWKYEISNIIKMKYYNRIHGLCMTVMKIFPRANIFVTTILEVILIMDELFVYYWKKIAMTTSSVSASLMLTQTISKNSKIFRNLLDWNFLIKNRSHIVRSQI